MMKLAGTPILRSLTAQKSPGQPNLKILILGALGVVYGDIGTSPIYALREALHASTGGNQAGREEVLGILSLIVWALTIIVTIKYIVFVLRADNRGEGGTLSLVALARRGLSKRSSIGDPVGWNVWRGAISR